MLEWCFANVWNLGKLHTTTKKYAVTCISPMLNLHDVSCVKYDYDLQILN